MLDSHCHLDHPAFDRDRDEVVARALGAGVAGFLVPGTAPETWDRTLSVRDRYRGVRVALGIHPLSLPGLCPEALARGLDALGPRLVEVGAAALGECGLDGVLAKRGGVPMALQLEVLSAQLDIAEALELPLVLHCRRAYGPLLALLSSRGPLRGVIHGYSGSAELLPRFAALGLHFGFGSLVTRPEARRAAAAARAAPADRILLETDAPDQPPRGMQRSEPSLLPRIARRLGALRGEAVRPAEAALGWGGA